MRGKPATSAVGIALFAALGISAGCGSSNDLSIGRQAEAGLTTPRMCVRVRDASVDAHDAGETDGGEEDAGEPIDALADVGIDAPPNDAECPDPVLCERIKSSLVHRYSFNGTGTMVVDSVGTANGTARGAQLRGEGTISLAGSTDQFVDLPNGIIRQLTNATFEVWVTWNGCGMWQRIFDFGDSNAGEGNRGASVSSLYLTPLAGTGGDPVLTARFKRADQIAMDEARVFAPTALQIGEMVHVALVVDDTGNRMTLYRNGVQDGTGTFNDSLSMLNDVNNWLGRSQYLVDPPFAGTIHEFRIYKAALTPAEVQVTFGAGPDAAFLN